MNDVLDIFIDSLQDAIIDTLYVVPFLFVTYLIMEWIEHKLSHKTREGIQKAGSAGPAIGAVLGVIPQCGFSAAASAFYAGRVITLGTLFAVYLSTSDEMLPIFIAGGVPIEQMFGIIGAKLLIGMFFGFLIDLFLRITKKNQPKFQIHELCKRSHCNCCGNCAACKERPESVYDAHDLHGHHDSHGHVHNHGGTSILKSALIHTVQITIFVFLITLALNLLIAAAGGEETLAQLAHNNKVAAVFISGLAGLIPNCAASVVIAQLYVDGLLGLGACMSGLLVAAGVGLLVLLKTNRPQSQNIIIIGVLYCVSVFCGLIICAIPV